MVAFLFRMPAGIPGSITRPNTALTVLAGQLSIANLFQSYGTPVVFEAATGRLRPVIAADVAASVVGFLVRPYPYTGSTVLGVSVPPQAGGTADRMTHGFMSVKVTNGTPTPGGAVYTRTILNGSIPAGFIGDIEAIADGVNTFIIPGATFTGGMDANGNSEIAYN